MVCATQQPYTHTALFDFQKHQQHPGATTTYDGRFDPADKRAHRPPPARTKDAAKPRHSCARSSRSPRRRRADVLPRATSSARSHLVESGGELLMVVQHCPLPLHDGTFQKQDVYRMDLINRRWADVLGPRGRGLLLGPSRFASAE
ncbi:hypothetical protein BRADI_1g65971v3 [Brachypodium distachyon]|uniref:KIB1-4 beta-propeller domain-containing protein n=1 Tax=Brachypodium distachyon TaxID=15368 RepID=A0A0Q3HHL5_BRADI|nr:hypothetical protein BRADI_1g65971v3 [Brachypodium distachyon]